VRSSPDPKKYQLDLFSPDNVYFEYFVVTAISGYLHRCCGTSAPASGAGEDFAEFKGKFN
jgi:hypothetical protein